MVIDTYTYDLIDSKMYIISEENSAIVIDPCISSEAMEMLEQKNISEVMVILTHEHYDHFSGIEMFRNKFTNCKVLCSALCNKYLQQPARNGSKFFSALFLDKEPEKLSEAKNVPPVAYTADMTFSKELGFDWHEHEINLIETPGHSPGSICLIIDDNILFSGDSLLKNDPVVVKLPGGNRKQYNERTVPFLLELDKEMRVFPGHGEGGLLKEFSIVEI